MYVIAEIGQAHDGSLGTAHAYIDAVARAGADAVKFQTHIAEAESTPGEPWRVAFSPQDATRFAYWKRMEFSEEQWAGLKAHADDVSIDFLSSPFSVEAVHLLRRVGVAAWKVASGEVGNTALLAEVLTDGRPIILSSGMSPLEELDRAVAAVLDGGVPLTVLQCTSEYPCPPERLGLNVLHDLRHRYDCRVGLSDHSGTIYAGLAAATLGAEVLEVHVTMSREAFGPDVGASITTRELADLTEGARFIATANANPVDKDGMAAALAPLRQLFTKSIVAGRDLAEGHTLGPSDVALKKPGTGLPADMVRAVLGMRLKRRLARDELIRMEDLEVQH